MYLLVFLCLEIRELIVSPATEHPNSRWVCTQARAFLGQSANRSEKRPDIIMHDRDTKFTAAFVDVLKAGGVTKAKSATTPPANCSPDTSPDADAAKLRVLRQMSPAQRSLLAARFSEEIRNRALSGIRTRHPELDERQVYREFARITLASQQFEQAYGKLGSEP
jgi:hypothetical protein